MLTLLFGLQALCMDLLHRPEENSCMSATDHLPLTLCSVCRSTDPWLSGMEKCQKSPIHRCRRFHGAGNPASLLLKDLPFLPAPAVHTAFVQHYCCQTYQIPLRDLRGKITALVIGATFRSRSEDTACLFIFQSVECADLTRRPFCFLFCFTFMYMTCLSQF